MEPDNPDFGIQQKPRKKKFSKSKIRSAKNVDKVWISRKTTSRAPFGAIPGHFLPGPKQINKNCTNFACFPWRANGPYSSMAVYQPLVGLLVFWFFVGGAISNGSTDALHACHESQTARPKLLRSPGRRNCCRWSAWATQLVLLPSIRMTAETYSPTPGG